MHDLLWNGAIFVKLQELIPYDKQSFQWMKKQSFKVFSKIAVLQNLKYLKSKFWNLCLELKNTLKNVFVGVNFGYKMEDERWFLFETDIENFHLYLS